VSKGRTFPTGVAAPILLEGMQVIRRVRSSPHPQVSSIARLTGLLYTFGLGSPEGLNYPYICRGVTITVLAEACALAGTVGNYVTGHWHERFVADWLLGHVTFAGWIFRASRAAVSATRHTAGAPVGKIRRIEFTVTESVEIGDWQGIVIDIDAALTGNGQVLSVL
jgi:hypothetical protein